MIGTDLHEQRLLHISYICEDKRSYQNMSISQTLGFSTLDLESFHKEQNTVKCQFLMMCLRFCGFMDFSQAHLLQKNMLSLVEARIIFCGYYFEGAYLASKAKP